MKRLALSTLAATLLFSAFAVSAQTTTPVNNAQLTTRPYIDADLAAYVQSGLSQLNRGDGSPFVFGKEYERRQALYQKLRAENFAKLQQAQG